MRAAWAAAALVACAWLAVPADGLAQRGRVRETSAQVDGGVKRRVRHRRSDAGMPADAGVASAVPIAPKLSTDPIVAPRPTSASGPEACGACSVFLLFLLVPALLLLVAIHRQRRRTAAARERWEQERREAEERERQWAEERSRERRATEERALEESADRARQRYERSIARARQRLGAWPPDMRIERVVAIDVETTSRDTEKARVVEVALVTSDGREFSSLVNAGVRIPKAAADIHGITNADVTGAPTFIEAWDRARELGLLDGFYPLAYHAPYDQRVIAAELARAGRVDEANDVRLAEWIDPCVAVQAFDHGSAKLVEACTRRRIRVGRLHRAAGDAHAALALWRALERERPRFTMQSLAQAIAWQLDQRDENDARRGRR